MGAAEAHPLSPAAAGAWAEKAVAWRGPGKAVEDGEVTGKTMGKWKREENCGFRRKIWVLTMDFTRKCGFELKKRNSSGIDHEKLWV